jgi:hypothetical protein
MFKAIRASIGGPKKVASPEPVEENASVSSSSVPTTTTASTYGMGPASPVTPAAVSAALAAEASTIDTTEPSAPQVTAELAAELAVQVGPSPGRQAPAPGSVNSSANSSPRGANNNFSSAAVVDPVIAMSCDSYESNMFSAKSIDGIGNSFSTDANDVVDFTGIIDFESTPSGVSTKATGAGRFGKHEHVKVIVAYRFIFWIPVGRKIGSEFSKRTLLNSLIEEAIMGDQEFGIDNSEFVNIETEGKRKMIKLTISHTKYPDWKKNLYFATEEESNRFMAAVGTNRSRTYMDLPQDMDDLPYFLQPKYNSQFQKLDDQAFRVFADHPQFRRFYTIAMLDRDSACRQIFIDALQTYLNARGVAITQYNPEAFINLLLQIVANPILVLLTSVFIVDRNLTASFKLATPATSGRTDDECVSMLLNAMLALLDRSHVNKSIMLAIYQYPASEKDITSNPFSRWFLNILKRNMEKKVFSRVSWNQLSTLFENTPQLSYVLIKRFVDMNDDNCAHICTAFDLVPESFLSEPFTLTAIGDTSYEAMGGDDAKCRYGSLVFHPMMHPKLRESITDNLCKRRTVFNDAFLNEFLDHAFDENSLLIAAKVFQGLVFDDMSGNVSGELILSPLLIPRLFDKMSSLMANKAEFLRLVKYQGLIQLLEVILRFESIYFGMTAHQSTQLRDICPLSVRVRDNHKLRSDYVKMFLDTDFHQHIARRFAKGADRFADAEASNKESKLIRSELTDILTGYFTIAMQSRKLHSLRTEEEPVHSGGTSAFGTTAYNDDAFEIRMLKHFFAVVSEAFYSTVFKPRAILRKRFVELIEKGLGTPSHPANIKGAFTDAIFQGAILTRAEHFRPTIFIALSVPTPNLDQIDRTVGVNLLLAALKMNCFKNLHRAMYRFNEDAGRAVDKAQQLAAIVAEIVRNTAHKESDYVDCKMTLNTVSAIAQYGASALKVLNNRLGREKLSRLLQQYLTTCPPSSWVGHFAGASTIAFFIKYLGRENLTKAYQQFRDVNAQDPVYLRLLETVQQQYSTPLVQPDDLDIDDNKSVSLLMERLIASAEEDEIEGMESVEIRLLKRIFVNWMQRMLRELNIPMIPRNTQVITYLTFVQAYRHIQSTRSNGNSPKALLMQVGTGEGKSLIAAMISIYIVTVLDKRVHILTNNVGLQSRDFSAFSKFYQAFGMSCSDKIEDRCHVTYCLRRDLETFHRESIFRGETKIFKDSILIVDEVDQLIVDEKPFQSFVREDFKRSGYLNDCFSALKKKGPSAVAPAVRGSSDGYPDSYVWERACRAYNIASSKQEGLGVPNGYCRVQSGEYVMNDARGIQVNNYYDLWLEYINFTRREGYQARFQSVFHSQSLCYTMKQYDFICGLSGSLGSPSERESNNQLYRTWNIHVPPFLNTCNEVVKAMPTLIDNCVYVYDSDQEQFNKLMETARNLAQGVPVLIIMENAAVVHQLYNLFTTGSTRSAKSPSAGPSNGNKSSPANSSTSALKSLYHDDSVQVLLNVGLNGQLMDWDQIVQNATRPRDVGQGYRITITDYWGGRGHDYLVTDEVSPQFFE